MNAITIGLVGAGTIGGGVVKLLHAQTGRLRELSGVSCVLRRIADTVPARFAKLPLEGVICSTSADDIINDPEIQIVIELVGGTGFARDLILRAIDKGKHVITANKALIAEFGTQIFDAARKKGVAVYFEASVGGGMPVIKTIREALVGNNILSVKTIINGTCNYILTQMSQHNLAFATALDQAQKNGYAEADPALDIGGGDSGHKVAVMGSLIYGGYVPYNKIGIEGITGITADDIAFASDMGYCIKLLGVLKKSPDSTLVDVRVHPALLHKDHILASVNDVFNAVLLEGDAVGKILLYGRGAGELPTASAVLSDIVDVCRNIASECAQRIPMDYYRQDCELSLVPLSEIESRYYLCFYVVDRPNVLASIATVLGGNSISIASVMQREANDGARVPVVIITHRSKESKLRAALSAIEKQDYIKGPTQVIRIEE